MHRLTAIILYIIHAFQNKNVPIHERVYVITPPYYLDWLERSYLNVPINQYCGPFSLQYMNIIQGSKQVEENGIDSLMQCSQFLNMIK